MGNQLLLQVWRPAWQLVPRRQFVTSQLLGDETVPGQVLIVGRNTVVTVPPHAFVEVDRRRIAVKEPGTVTRPIIEELISDILIVDETALENAVQVLIERQRLVVEGAGAAGLAAVLDNPERFKGMKTGIIVTGGNIDSRILSSILMRGLVREGRLVRLRVHITDAPGVLSTVAGLIGACGGNIIEVYHQRLFRDVPVKEADVDVVVETLNVEHVHEITEKLTQAGFGVRLLGDTSLNTEH